MISIAMCTYNGQRFIKDQLDSILNQSYNNFELIITDDCSSDETVSIINGYTKKDDRIKLIQNTSNLGFVKNFEKAISLCSGEYIALADQDDIWKENKLKVFLEEIKNNTLIYSDAILIDENSQEIGGNLICPNKNLVDGACNKSFLLSNCVSGNTLMFKKELVEHILPIPKGISFHDAWIAFVASTVGTIAYTEKSMTYYRRYSDQITNTRAKDYENFFDRFIKKKNIRIDNAKSILKDLNSFLLFRGLKDQKTINILKELIKHYIDFENIYYNFKLHKLLTKHKHEVFKIQKTNKINNCIRKTSMGLKLHTSTLFIV